MRKFLLTLASIYFSNSISSASFNEFSLRPKAELSVDNTQKQDTIVQPVSIEIPIFSPIEEDLSNIEEKQLIETNEHDDNIQEVNNIEQDKIGIDNNNTNSDMPEDIEENTEIIQLYVPEEQLLKPNTSLYKKFPEK